jgi:hypothetical protein
VQREKTKRTEDRTSGNTYLGGRKTNQEGKQKSIERRDRERTMSRK